MKNSLTTIQWPRVLIRDRRTQHAEKVQKIIKNASKLLEDNILIKDFLTCKISDVLTEPDTALDVNITEKPVKSYETNKKFSAGVGGKVALDIFKELPSIKAEATAAGGISITVKTGGLALKTIDEKAFERQLRSR